VEGSVAGQIVMAGDVKIVGYLNVPGRIAASASLLYAKNLVSFLETMVSKDTKLFLINPEDELVKATLLTHGGAVVHPAFVSAEAPAKAAMVEKPAKAAASKPAAKPAAKKTPVKSKGAK
jgi:H+-translocating NAD(P) transhydrogenase subunit alpha